MISSTCNLLHRELCSLFDIVNLLFDQVKFLKITVFILINYFVSGDIKVFDFLADSFNFELNCI